MQQPAPPRRTGWSSLVLDASGAVLRVERWLILALMALLMVLILVNVATRYTGMPIYWIDEAAVYSVVWLTFVGGSAMTRLRMDFAVTLLTDKLGAAGARLFRLAAGAGVLLFGLAMLWMCWIWMDPVGIARAGFDAKAFAGTTFNFLYTERTQTLNWPTWLLQTILPLFASTLSLHAAANLVEDLGWQPRRGHAGFPVSDAEAVVN
ncbi:TRAP transporter small permease [Piscinibacter sakaiensis]|uniref:TRAP transporter small permease protein n=1 Tax=Piscinibacter sakaiensis TaxID=1547922 RepID=A0A0K8NZ30_PISS1|nr:TRAP transporter small permease [Piscinibacter sakaiensis]GAP35643.1 TRAP-type transport system, small permease component, putative N-acetylneuraminate transporter [Piscinibacter sakaiensis]